MIGCSPRGEVRLGLKEKQHASRNAAQDRIGSRLWCRTSDLCAVSPGNEATDHCAAAKCHRQVASGRCGGGIAHHSTVVTQIQGGAQLQYPTGPAQHHSELQRKSVHSAGRFARGLAHAYDSSARYELVPLLPRELPSGAAPVLARIFDLPKLLIYNENLVDALGLEPRWCLHSGFPKR
jgi:hypothetical protein